MPADSEQCPENYVSCKIILLPMVILEGHIKVKQSEYIIYQGQQSE